MLMFLELEKLCKYVNMDIKQATNYRTNDFKQYEFLGGNKYDYAHYGILNKTLPKILFKGNSILVTFLQLIDLRIIMLLKYIDKVKQFKWISYYE